MATTLTTGKCKTNKQSFISEMRVDESVLGMNRKVLVNPPDVDRNLLFHSYVCIRVANKMKLLISPLIYPLAPA